MLETGERLSRDDAPRAKPEMATVVQLLHGLTVGGAEVLAARIARGLADRYRFVFVCLDEVGPLADELRAAGAPLHFMGRRSGLDWRCARDLARLWRRERPALIHAHQYTPFFYAAGSRLLGGGAPVLFTEHGRWFPDYPRRKRMLANRLLLRKGDRVVGVGRSVRKALIDNEGLPPERVGVIHNGIDTADYAARAGRADRAAIRQSLGLAEEDLVIVQVARLDDLKDHLTGLRAFARVRERFPTARLLLVGDGPERAAIEAETARLRLGASVTLLGTRRDVPELLGAADLCWLTSKSEGIPLTLIEALAVGLPVVSTNVGGISEIVEHGQTGLLAPAGDERALAEAACQLIAAPDLRRTWGAAGKEQMQARFDESQMLAAYDRLYAEMLAI